MTAKDAVRAREDAKRPKPPEPVKRKRALPDQVFASVMESVALDIEREEVVNELDAIGEGDQ